MSEVPPGIVDDQIDAVSRSVKAEPGEGTTGIALETSQVYATDAADLWDAVTTAERLARWFAPVHGDLAVGGSFQVEGNASGVVQSCEPPFRFTATWAMGEPATLIDVRIEPVDVDHARLRLIHTGEVETGFWELYGPGAVGVGWDLSLLGLQFYLTTGTSRPAETDAWGVSDQAKAFMTASSRRWADASVAAGTPEEAARSAEAATVAFYTGG